MPLLTINHKTVYHYSRPVAFGEHRIMLRPRDGHDLRVLSSSLDIEPQPMRLRWIHDVFGNSVAIATFDERADTLSFTSTVTVEHNPEDEFALTADDPAISIRFSTTTRSFPTSSNSSRRNMAIPMASCRPGRGNFSTPTGRRRPSTS